MEKLSFLQQTSLFVHLPSNQLERIAADITLNQYRTGETVFCQGENGHSLYVLHSGLVRIFVNSSNGHETSVILLGQPGQLFGELAVIDDCPRSATAVAVIDTELFALNRDHLSWHMSTCPALAQNLLCILSARVRYNTRMVNTLTSLGTVQRVALTLEKLAEEYGRPEGDGILIEAPLTQDDLASLVGATRESVNKCLRQFRKQRWIQVSRQQIVVLDMDALHIQANA